jgi:hypothetical protein
MNAPAAPIHRHAPFSFLSLLAAALAIAPAVRAAAFAEADVAAFTDRYCSSCHNDVDKEGGLDLTSLKYSPADPANFQTWVKMHDRVQAGEMPPKEKKRPTAADTAGFIKALASGLTSSEIEASQREGRTTRRRLNRTEYENAVRDLLQAPWLLVKEQLPEDGEAFKFNKVSYALDVSYVHMQRYMMAAEAAMQQVMAVKISQPEPKVSRFYFRDDPAVMNNQRGQRGDREKFPLLGSEAQPEVRRTAEGLVRKVGALADDPKPEAVPWTVGKDDPKHELEAVGWVSSNYVTGFDSRWSQFRAPVTGKYRLRFSGYTVWVGPNGDSWNLQGPPGQPKKEVYRKPSWFRPNYDDVTRGRRYEPITVYAQGGVANRRIGGFDVTPEPGVQDLGEVWMHVNEYIVTDASRFYRSRPTGFQGGFTNALAQKDGMPAVAFRWMEVEGPIYDDATTAGYRLMFGDLPAAKAADGAPGVEVLIHSPGGRGRGGQINRGAGAVSGLSRVKVEVASENPEQDAERLIRNFVARAYRRPAAESDIKMFVDLVKQRMKAGLGFAGSMLAGYTAVLASPQFVFVDEEPGKLDDRALATRLALFLWNSEPDVALRAKAAAGELHKPDVLRAETERLLNDPRSERFVSAFLDYWLEIRRMDETTPSTTLYNDYYLDDSLTEAATDESRMFFAELLKKNLPARNIVDSDFTYLNDRLAVHYGMPGVNGVAMRRVALPAETPRGGFMTQAAVLKVTANGTTTSPVLRGKWIMERIVGFEMPPPPAAVPAVEPDIRGAVTIRQQLDKHRADESCALCHRKIDPPGFALENFDVMGAWRDRYRATAIDAAPEPGFGKNGWPFAFHLALPVDSSGMLADGSSFQNVRDFKRLLLRDEAQIARNFTRQLSVFATGAPVRFSDRAKIEQIVQRAKGSQYGIRTIVNELIQSELFLNK